MKDFCLLLASETNNTPSQREGMDKETETENRKKGSFLIQKTARKMHFPHKTALTALYYFQIFYTKKSMFDFPFQDIALTCILVASKVEATERKIGEIISIGLSVLNPQLKTKDTIKLVETQLDKINQYELVVLENIDFMFNLEHAHSYLLKIAKKNKLSNETVYKAWRHLNQLYHTQIVLRYPLPLFAISAIICVVGQKKSLLIIEWGKKVGFEENELLSVSTLIESIETRVFKS